jgi:DNA polymerase-1
MQGTAADIIKKAMISVDAWLRHSETGAEIIMQVHDELVLEVPTKMLAAVRTRVTDLMAGAADLRVPLKVDAGSGANWDEAH